MNPARSQYSIVALAFAINLVSYIDRVCISVAAPGLTREFGFTPLQMGQVFGIFSLSYALFQAPWGMAADRFGARGIVALGILGWSLFTGLTAAAWNLMSLLAIRLVFGAIEACLSPAVSSAFARWIPVAGRSTAFGVFLSGGRMGGAVAPPVAALIVLRYGWRASFLSFAGLGVVAGFAWWNWYRDAPPQQQMKAVLPPPVWKWPLVCLLATAFTYTFMWQFYITWFPTYLIEKRGFGLAEAGRYAGLPFLFGLAANWIGGVLADVLVRKFGVRAGRTGFGSGAFLASALLLYLGIGSANRNTAAVLIALAAGTGDLTLGAVWASAVDIGGKAAGAVGGLTNSASNFAGFLSPLAFGWVLQTWKDWNPVLMIAILSNVIAACFWLGVNADTSAASS